MQNLEVLRTQVRRENARLVRSIRARAERPGNVLGPCLASYEDWVERNPTKRLHNLTQHLLFAREETARAIRERMEIKWAGYEDAARRIESSVTNSLRRSAGTNYQALVTFALAETLREQGSLWYVAHPVPRQFGESLSIRFTGGILDLAVEEIADLEEVKDGGEDEAFRVTPDVDILVRHAGWDPERSELEPILLLSVKTSLADRAGSAARWKTYFDLVTKPCEHRDEETCAWARLGIDLEEPLRVDITHGLVTANIYKIGSDDYFTRNGELGTGQARANTFMFDLKITTRNDGVALQPPGWEDYNAVLGWLATTSARFELAA